MSLQVEGSPSQCSPRSSSASPSCATSPFRPKSKAAALAVRRAAYDEPLLGVEEQASQSEQYQSYQYQNHDVSLNRELGRLIECVAHEIHLVAHRIGPCQLPEAEGHPTGGVQCPADEKQWKEHHVYYTRKVLY